MPIIALSLSLLFSSYMVLRDVRGRRNLSATIWIPTVLLLVLGSRPVSNWMSGGQGHDVVGLANEQESSPVDTLFYLAVLSSCLFVGWRRGFRWGRLLRDNAAIMLFYLYFALSVFWSGDPTGSIKRLIKDFGLIVVAGVVFSEEAPLEALRAIYIRCAYVLLPLSVVFIKWFPTYGRSYGFGGDMQFTGVTTQKNGLGEITMIFTLFMIWDYLESRVAEKDRRAKRFPWELAVMVFLAVWLMRISESKTALVCTTLGFLLLWRKRLFASQLANIMVLTGALCLPFLVLFSQEFGDVIAPILRALGRNPTFTGRTEIWQHITLQTVNPIVGSGFWNFWGGPGALAINEAMHGQIPNAHNGYLDLYLDGGIIGLTLLFAVLIVSGVRLSNFPRVSKELYYFQRIRFSVLIIAIVYNLSETAYARVSLIWFTTLLMIVDFRFAERVVQPKRAKLKSSWRTDASREAGTFVES